MPAWSYGNRLYRTIWVEEDTDGLKRRKIGRYRNATGQIYLPFAQSWPVFRRHVYLAARAMAVVDGAADDQLDEPTEEELHFQERLRIQHRCPFVFREYWLDKHPHTEVGNLYWCSIDLEKFYPSLNLEVIRQNIVDELPPGWKEEANRLLLSMLHFQLDCNEWTDKDLLMMGLTPGQKIFGHIPTGLYVSGFLANAAMLKVDQQVSELLKVRNVAHFRFVDDHVLLAYSFQELVEWAREYANLLAGSITGARINPQKIAPKELEQFLFAHEQPLTSEQSEVLQKKSQRACQLDPRFPSPLMTKTLALVSAIARTDFNLLESEELAALTDELELLLLVDIPDAEIPDKTRLSFAATRLTRIAECWLSNPQPRAELIRRRDGLRDRLKKLNPGSEEHKETEEEVRFADKKIIEHAILLKNKVDRAFHLLRKVLRERPDRTRLWTRALRMCRLTGVKGIAHLLADISQVSITNPLAGEYLKANMLILLGEHALLAARTLKNDELAHWRRVAASSFLEEVSATKIPSSDDVNARWFLRLSWLQYCFGLYCAHLVLTDGEKTELSAGIVFPEEQVAIGGRCSARGNEGHEPAHWAWWTTRATLKDLNTHAEGFVKVLGAELKNSSDLDAFWRFFPLDAPTSTLKILARELQQRKRGHSEYKIAEGWWFDALRGRQEPHDAKSLLGLVKSSKSLERLLTPSRSDLSLYEWCERVKRLADDAGGDPRCGEWTALEIVRRIAEAIDRTPTFGPQYIKEAKRAKYRLPSLHPANFRIPKAWLEIPEPTWTEWRSTVDKTGIKYARVSDRIEDNRYTPLNTQSSLFPSANPVRGLGLLLFGLLRKTFDFPASWNGPGHAAVLEMLPKLLLHEITCSSWTLGVLSACLQTRAIENLYLDALPQIDDYYDIDTLRDPLKLKNAEDVRTALAICQKVLENNQLSTMSHKARQRTPVSILQLTQPQWSKDFENAATEEGATGG